MIPLRDENPTSRFAVVTLALIIVNVAVYFAIQFPKTDDAETTFLYEWAAVPCELRTGAPIEAVPVGSETPPDACVIGATGLFTPRPAFPDKPVYAAVLFAMFLHGSILHLAFNMLFLWVFGNNVEDQLGPIWFLVLYLAGGIVASIAHVAGNLHSVEPFIGASGAIAVVMGAYIVWFPRARVLTLIVFLPVQLPAVGVLGAWFVLQFFTQSSSGIATLAHIGGFVFGVLVAYVLHYYAGFPRSGPPRPGLPRRSVRYLA